MHATYEQLYVFRCLCFIYIYIYMRMVRENPVFVREFKIDGSKKRVGSSLLINVPDRRWISIAYKFR